ncbi:MAG: GAF domain-containing protein [Candidatus Krumholzibacteriota bacterium]|nr:GAF domain-containing protein [Candidatus Krumholzibacteriota bacterium]
MKSTEEKNEKLKIYAEKLSGLNKLKANFVATISHEFRTPLTSIKAYCETLLNNVDNVDRNILKEFLVVIDEESDRLMSLVDDILDFSQMESGAVRYERTPCDLKDIVDLVTKDLEKEFKRKNITLNTDLPEGPANVRAERELMKQLMGNLVQNAVKFTPDDGNVLIRVEDETVAIRIIVQDDGIGIPDDQLENIFDHFHQADGSSTREHGGTGMGLAICRNIVEWHDGKIWVENMSGRGSRFVVVIPKKQVIVRTHVMNLDGTMRRFEAERYLEVLVEMIAELMSVKTASIMMLDTSQNELRIESAIGLDEEIVEHARVKMGEGIAGKVAMEGQPYLVTDIESDSRVDASHNDFIYNSRSFISVPIRLNEEVVGVVNVSNPSHKRTFEPGDCDLLMLFTERIALALDKLLNFTSKSTEFEEVQATFRSMLDARRYIDDRSADAISSVLQGVARRLGLGSTETATLRYVYNVYDLGLARIGSHIIKQPKQLSEKERKSVKQHTIIGTNMLKKIEKIPAVRDAVLYHHENFDGSGYPGSLVGEEIPLMARIIRVTDTFRALVSHRPYQRQYTVREAVDVLHHRSGTFFDPKIVSVFVEALKGFEHRFLPSTPQGADEHDATVATTK